MSASMRLYSRHILPERMSQGAMVNKMRECERIKERSVGGRAVLGWLCKYKEWQDRKEGNETRKEG